MEFDRSIGFKKGSRIAISREITMLVLFFFLSVTAVSFFIAPQYKQMKLIKMEMEMKEKNLKLKQDVIGEIENFNKAYRGLNDKDLVKFYNLLPKKDNVEEQIANINKLAGLSLTIDEIGVKALEEADAKEGKKDEDIGASLLTYSARGAFSDFMRFLDALENSIPLANLSELKMEKGKRKKEENAAEDNVLDYDVSFLFYYLN